MRTRRTSFVSLLTAVALVVSILATPTAGAEPADPGEQEFDARQQRVTRGQSTETVALAKGQKALVRLDPASGTVGSILPLGTALTERRHPGFDPIEVARSFVRDNAELWRLDTGQLVGLEVASVVSSPRGAATHVWLQQRVDGIEVFGGLLGVTVDRLGRVVWSGGSLWPDVGDPIESRLTSEEAVAAGATSPDNEVRVEPRKVIFPLPGSEGRMAWFTVVDKGPDAQFETVVDAVTGEILYRRNQVQNSGPQGTVFREQNPEATGATRQVTSFAGAPFNDNGWVDDTQTVGNNALACHDPDGDNSCDYTPTTPTSGDPGYQHFDYPFTNAIATSMGTDYTTDRDATVTQAFYYTNLAHDRWYSYGFDEDSGNFQDDNFGHGGSDGDRVLVLVDWDADNGTCCNATMNTPGDGSSPTMRLYIETPGGGIFGHGALDGDTVIHEYGHGVHNRLVNGGMGMGTGVQTGALGEGWGDAMAFSVWNDPILFEYVTTNKTTGLRRVAYDTSSLTYANLCQPTACEVHNDGEIWATALWDLRDYLIDIYGQATGVTRFEQLMIDGMKNTPGSADFLDARDGILVSENTIYSNVDFCGVWNAFAINGMGVNASSSADQQTVTEAFDVPPACAPTANADGSYTTPEGTDVTLDATGSMDPSDSSGGTIVSFEWDLDNDGDFDDATGATTTFSKVGDNGVFTVGVKVTTTLGVSDEDTATVTVTNVAPTVSLDAVSSTSENTPITLSGQVSDPGWEDSLTATVDWDDGDGAQSLSGTLENLRPDATLSFSVGHTYGDNGSYDVEVCGTDDDDAASCSTVTVEITNSAPTAAIDADTYVAHAGDAVDVSANSTDPGSDDLTATWLWGDSEPDTVVTSLVNPPVLDPPKSPSIQPRDVDWMSAHTYADACLYALTLSVVDDDGGSAEDTATVIVAGNDDRVRASGWWMNQYRPKPPNDFSRAELECYLEIVSHMSDVFVEERSPLGTRAHAVDVLFVKGNNGNADELFDEQLLAAWLTFANGGFDLDTMVDTDGDATPDTTFAAAVSEAESVRLDPTATDAELLEQKDMLEGMLAD